jgi:transcriptional regulator with XRE-family HTH domain
MNGFSMDDLCREIGFNVSKNSIFRYEPGIMLPSSSVLIMLADALGVKVEYFFRPFTVSIDKIEFRKMNVVVSDTNIFIDLHELTEIPYVAKSGCNGK